MCGIIGYVGKKNIGSVIIHGLECVEYRGYDSAGISVLDNNKIRTVKSVGKIENLKKKLKKIDLNNSTCGIGHTRWATHGEVSELNAHPQVVNKVSVVHNGIIENYKEIERELKSKYSFKSDTDSERIAALIDSFAASVVFCNWYIKAIHKLKGSYAIGVIFEGVSKIYGVRKDAPLVLGIGSKEHFIASDISAIIDYTNKYIYLDDNEIVEADKDFNIYYDGVIIKKKIETASWDRETANKNGYDHYMLKEINEQEELAKKLYSKYIPNDKFSDLVIDLTKYKRIDFVACGSAYNASLIAKYFADKYCSSKDFYVNCYVASEYRYTNHYFDKDVLVVLISQSGETADTLAVLRMCNSKDIDTLAIVNVVSSTIAREAKFVMPMLAGPEICVATTKGFFSQSYLCSLLMLKYMYKKNIINKDFDKWKHFVSS